MKTLKTAMGMRHIDDSDLSQIPSELRKILLEHRAALIDKMIVSGLGTYISYKFRRRATPNQIDEICTQLMELKTWHIGSRTYQTFLDAVAKNEFINVNNSQFYEEIDTIISAKLLQPMLFADASQVAL